MIIKSYSSITDDQFKPADFPCVKMFFPVNETDAGATLTDAVSGGTIGNFANQTRDGTKMTTTGNSTSGADPTFGSFAIGTLDAILFVVADLSAAAAIVLSDTSVSNFISIEGSAGVSFTDGTNTATAADLPDVSAVVGHIAILQPGTAGEGNYDKTTAAAYTAGAAQNAAPADLTTFGAAPMTKFSCTFGSGTIFYGAAVFVFTNGIPANYKAACAWMFAEWTAGRKSIYPGWKGLA